MDERATHSGAPLRIGEDEAWGAVAARRLGCGGREQGGFNGKCALCMGSVVYRVRSCSRSPAKQHREERYCRLSRPQLFSINPRGNFLSSISMVGFKPAGFSLLIKFAGFVFSAGRTGCRSGSCSSSAGSPSLPVSRAIHRSQGANGDRAIEPPCSFAMILSKASWILARSFSTMISANYFTSRPHLVSSSVINAMRWSRMDMGRSSAFLSLALFAGRPWLRYKVFGRS